MAIDRFNIFKQCNYDMEFRWGNNKMNHPTMINRKPLNDTQREWLVSLTQATNKESNKTYLRSILAQGKTPTPAQKEVIKSISNNLAS